MPPNPPPNQPQRIVHPATKTIMDLCLDSRQVEVPSILTKDKLQELMIEAFDNKSRVLHIPIPDGMIFNVVVSKITFWVMDSWPKPEPKITPAKIGLVDANNNPIQ